MRLPGGEEMNKMMTWYVWLLDNKTDWRGRISDATFTFRSQIRSKLATRRELDSSGGGTHLELHSGITSVSIHLVIDSAQMWETNRISTISTRPPVPWQVASSTCYSCYRSFYDYFCYYDHYSALTSFSFLNRAAWLCLSPLPPQSTVRVLLSWEMSQLTLGMYCISLEIVGRIELAAMDLAMDSKKLILVGNRRSWLTEATLKTHAWSILDQPGMKWNIYD